MNHNKQRGMSLLMLMTLLVLVAFAAVITMRIFPIYKDDMIIGSGLAKVKETPNLATERDKEIRRVFLTYLYQQGVQLKVFNDEEVEKHIDIQRTDGGFEMTVKYQRTVPFIANISLLFDFENSIRVP